MGYDINTHKITVPISTEDVSEALNELSGDIGTLCVSDEINDWAKYKPIVYPSWKELTENQRIGTAEDNRNNIFYGIKISGLPTSAIIDESFADMHSATFKYIKPSGGPFAPFRILDFDGYNHNAVPNPYASFASDGNSLEGFYNDADLVMGGISGITVQYSENNLDGVNFAEILAGGKVSLSDVLNKAYPCILITDKAGSTYFTALSTTIDDNGNTGPSKLVRNGEIINKTWFVKMSKPVKSETSVEGGTPAPPWISAQTGMKATLFLLESADLLAPVLTKLGDNFHDNWIKVESGGLAITRAPIVLPGAIGLDLTLKQYFSGIVFEPTEVNILTLQTATFVVSLEEITGATSSNDIEITVTLNLDNDGSVYTQTMTRAGWPSGKLDSVSIPTQLLHFPGTTYAGRVSITTKDGNVTNTSKTLRFSETI